MLSSSSDFINEINKFYKNAKDSVEGNLNSIIALRVLESDQINDLYESVYDKIKQIENEFKTRVFLYQIENGENVEDLFFYLLKKFVKMKDSNKKQRKKKESVNSKKKKVLNSSVTT